jgi:hypothetical protein
MAKASLAPPSLYRRHYYITEHAIQQFRERHPKHDMLHRFDGDIGNLLDWAVNDQWDERLVCRDTRDENAAIHILDLQPVLNEALWALVKDNESGAKGNRLPLAVVTILTHEMVESYQRAGRWVTNSGAAVEVIKPTLTSKLADKLKGVTLPPASPAVIFSDPPPPAPVSPLPPLATYYRELPTLHPEGVKEDTRLLTYTDAHGPTYEALRKEEALNRVMELKGAGVAALQVWKPVKVKIVVEEE